MFLHEVFQPFSVGFAIVGGTGPFSTASCNFESPECSNAWKSSGRSGATWPWYRWQRGTPSHGTGPRFDHTLATSQGKQQGRVHSFPSNLLLVLEGESEGSSSSGHEDNQRWKGGGGGIRLPVAGGGLHRFKGVRTYALIFSYEMQRNQMHQTEKKKKQLESFIVPGSLCPRSLSR